MTRTSWALRSSLSLWAMLCVGCFSNADFTECNASTDRQPCGTNGVCSGTAEECVEMPIDRTDAGTGEGGEGGEGGGAAGEGGEGGGDPNVLEVDTLAGPLVFQPSERKHVIINRAQVMSGIATISGARIIDIRAGLVVNGGGQDGGLGGGAGAGQDTRMSPAARGGTGAEDGGDGTALAAGGGGAGNAGSRGPSGVLLGGDGGDDMLSAGADGQPAVYLLTCDTFQPTDVRLGGGGSGAGGGRGGLAMGACVGPGGGGGGRGGVGGGVIVLQATEEIIISGTLAARGEAGGTGHPGIAGCANCDSCAADAGNGGDGATEADDFGGDSGGDGAGRGGNGGAGSGGLIVLVAPRITFASNTRIDVTGGTGGPESSGLVYIEGATSVGPNIMGASADRTCLVP